MFHSSLLSLSPRLTRDGERILVRSNLLQRVLTLGVYSRTVWIEPAKSRLRVQTRSWWFRRKRQRISFESIQAVTYDYEDVAFERMINWAHQAWDSFRVGLRFFDQSELHLFTFFGAGSFTNNGPLPDWCYLTETTFDVTGMQQTESRRLVDLLAKMTGVAVSPSRGY